MSRGDSRSRVRAAAAEWAVSERVPQPGEVDVRLRDGRGRTGQLQVLIDHDNPSTGPCPGCGWVPTTTRRDCPSRVIAKALLDRAPLPAWLAHLAGDVPGARSRQPLASADERRAAADASPGLFDPPPRTRPGGDRG